MASDYGHVHDYYTHMHDLQTMPQYNHYSVAMANTSVASPYELTPVDTLSSCAEVANGTVQQLHHQHDSRKRKIMHYQENFESTICEEQISTAPASSMPAPPNRSRKRNNSLSSGSLCEEDGCDDSRSTRTFSDKKQNHSEIEKRRRDKMNTYITELRAMVPLCGAMARKLDKLTVLRMAVQHMRTVTGSLSACPLNSSPRPSYLSEQDLNGLVLQAANDCFLLVVGCNRGKLLYISTSVKNMLMYDQSELLGQSLFDILHPKDVSKVKEQLSLSDLSPRDRLIDAKTMLPVKADMSSGASRFGAGARRSFFCRIKYKLTEQASNATPAKEESDPKMCKKKYDKKYCVIQCTGYLKSWSPMDLSGCDGVDIREEGDADNLPCLVAVGRVLPDLGSPALSPYGLSPPTRPLQYISRHTTDGKYVFVDQRATLALGFLPQELLGTSLYEYLGGPEMTSVARTHKAALLTRDSLDTPPYSFRRKDGTFIYIQTHFKPFKNPWTKDVECLVANNTVMANEPSPQTQETQSSYDIYKQKADLEMQRLIDSQVESHKIGSAIAEEVLRRSSAEFSPELPVDLLQEAVFNQQCDLSTDAVCDQATVVDNILEMDSVAYDQVLTNVSLRNAEGATPPPDRIPFTTDTPPRSTSPPLPPLGADGNGEAAMAVIMNLLEADAGLADATSFTDLPWSLP